MFYFSFLRGGGGRPQHKMVFPDRKGFLMKAIYGSLPVGSFFKHNDGSGELLLIKSDVGPIHLGTGIRFTTITEPTLVTAVSLDFVRFLQWLGGGNDGV